MKTQTTIYINGEFLKVDPEILDIFTPGSFEAKGVFETMLAVGQDVFDVDLHLKRLRGSFKGAKVSAGMISKLVKLNDFAVSRVRVIAWREGRQKHTVAMTLKHSLPKNESYKVCLVKTDRAATARFANIKSLDYKIFAQAYHKARARGFDEVLLINNKGFIFEASRANVFWVKNNKIFTPPLSSGCLNGITRAKVIKLVQKLKIPFGEKNLSIKDLRSADTVFLTNSLIGVKSIKNSFPLLPR